MVKNVFKPDFTIELAEEICALVTNGRTLTSISRMEGKPSLLQMHGWVNKHPEFGEALERAYTLRADTRADDLDDIVRDVRSGDMTPKAAKAIADIRKWQAAKDNPIKYSDRITQQHTGRDGSDLVLSIRSMISDLPPSNDVKKIGTTNVEEIEA